VLQCVAVCCSVHNQYEMNVNRLVSPKLRLSVRCSVLQCVAVFCSVHRQYESPAAKADVERALQCGAVCCSALQ